MLALVEWIGAGIGLGALGVALVILVLAMRARDRIVADMSAVIEQLRRERDECRAALDRMEGGGDDG